MNTDAVLAMAADLEWQADKADRNYPEIFSVNSDTAREAGEMLRNLLEQVKLAERRGIERAVHVIEARAYECVVEAAAWQRDAPTERSTMLLIESRAKTLENVAAAIRALLTEDQR